MSDERQLAGAGQIAAERAAVSAERSADKPERGGASATARRDAMISQLERALSDERENSATLLKTAEDLRFKMQVLEQSYAKQLEVARQRCAAAEEESSGAVSRIAELEAAHEENLQLLSEAQDQLHRVKGQRDQIMRQPGTRADWPVAAASREQEWYEEGTINALMDDDKWSRKPAPGGAQPQVSKPVEQDDAIEDLISPDWAFTRERD